MAIRNIFEHPLFVNAKKDFSNFLVGPQQQTNQMFQPKTPSRSLDNLFSGLKDLGQGIAGGVAQITKNVTDLITKYTSPSTYVEPAVRRFGISTPLALGLGIAADLAVPGGGKNKAARIFSLKTGEIQGKLTQKAAELSDESYLFHQTPFSNIKSIIKEGLIPNKNYNFENSKKGVYFSNDASDTEYVMRQSSSKENALLRLKTGGPNDYWSYKNSYGIPDENTLNSLFFKRKISPDDLEVWTGKYWVPLKSIKTK